METWKTIVDSGEAAECVLWYAPLASCNLYDCKFGTQCFLYMVMQR